MLRLGASPRSSHDICSTRPTHAPGQRLLGSAAAAGALASRGAGESASRACTSPSLLPLLAARLPRALSPACSCPGPCTLAGGAGRSAEPGAPCCVLRLLPGLWSSAPSSSCCGEAGCCCSGAATAAAGVAAGAAPWPPPASARSGCCSAGQEEATWAAGRLLLPRPRLLLLLLLPLPRQDLLLLPAPAAALAAALAEEAAAARRLPCYCRCALGGGGHGLLLLLPLAASGCASTCGTLQSVGRRVVDEWHRR